jgi:hypothetical protein
METCFLPCLPLSVSVPPSAVPPPSCRLWGFLSVGLWPGADRIVANTCPRSGRAERISGLGPHLTWGYLSQYAGTVGKFGTSRQSNPALRT